MITIESGTAKVNRGIDEVPITHWPAGELWDIPRGLLDAAEPLGQVVLPYPTKIPVEERAQRIEQELRLKFNERARKAQEQWKPIYWQAAAEQQAKEAQFERGYRAAQETQAHERKMAEMAARLQEKEAEAREREQLLATQQELSLFRQAQRTIESEESLIRAQRQREQIEAMRRPRPPITPVKPPARPRPEAPTTPATPLPETVFRPLSPVAPPATAAFPTPLPGRAIVELPRPVAPPVQRITGGGAPVPIRAAAPAQAAPGATQEAAYDVQMSRMYPSAGDMQRAREQQIRAVQMLSDLGQYPRARRQRIIPGRQYQPRRPTQAQIQAAQRQRAAAARRRPVTPPPQRPRGQTVARQRPTRSRVMRRYQPPRQVRASERPVQPTRRAAPARPRTGLTTGRRTAVARRSPAPRITQNIVNLLRRYR